MNISRCLSWLSVILLFSCIDRVNYDVDLPYQYPITIDGHITNAPGPYYVKVSSSFDVQSQDRTRSPLSVGSLRITDELGNSEVLTRVQEGLYQTSPTGLQGRVGGVYTLHIELLDGRVYESLPDTLLPPGHIDRFYHEFNSMAGADGASQYGFDLKVDAYGNERKSKLYMWSITNTFKAVSTPELMNIAAVAGQAGQCYPIPEQGKKCNYLPLCTGLRNKLPPREIPGYPFNFDVIGPCECCTCWYNLFNNAPILSDELYNSTQTYFALPVYRLPLNGWIFMFKVHTEVKQLTLTKNTFRFFGSIRDQKSATGSLFQPVTGKIPIMFIQKAGKETPINGIFYAAGADMVSMYLSPDDVPNQDLIPEINKEAKKASCFDLFPNATNKRPTFWVD